MFYVSTGLAGRAGFRFDSISLHRKAFDSGSGFSRQKRLLTRSQNLWEETFLRLCVETLKRVRVRAVWLCDRGFYRVEWLSRLKQFKQVFVVRLQRDVLAQIDQQKVLMKNLLIEKGSYQDFGFVRLRADGKAKLRLISVYAAQADEVWWLATNLKLSVTEIVWLYDRRMSIEEQFRDSKGIYC